MVTNYVNSGRKPKFVYSIGGKVFTSLSNAAATLGVNKTTITRWCDNPEKTDCFREPVGASEISQDPPRLSRRDVDEESKKEGKTPLQYMLDVMNDPSADEKLRAQMANWAAPYIHPKASVKTGKKEEREELAKQAGTGRFSASAPPKLKAVK